MRSAITMMLLTNESLLFIARSSSLHQRSRTAYCVAALMSLAIQYPAEFPSLLRTTLYALLAATAFVRGRRTLRTHVALADGGEEARTAVENALSSYARSDYS